MSHMWDRGVLNESSWHGLETVANMYTASDLIAHGEESGAWPQELRAEAVVTPSGLTATGYEAIVASYLNHPERVLGVVGSRYRHTLPTEWRELITAAVEAGAVPTGAFSLCNGAKILATFEVTSQDGFVTYLVLADSFDGSTSLVCGTTTIRVLCANTMDACMRKDGKGFAKIRHTQSAEQKIKALRHAIAESVKEGNKVVDLYKRAAATRLSGKTAHAAFDLLFPEATEDAGKRAQTLAKNARDEAKAAAKNELNREGAENGNLATLWNAATWLVDRRANGSARPSSDPLNSLLFGQRGRKIAEIQEKIEVLINMADGSTQSMRVPEATDIGADPKQIGRAVLDQILAD